MRPAVHPPRTVVRDLLSILFLTAVYVFTAKFGLRFGAIGGLAAPIWPPAGISLAALLIFGFRLWPGIALGAFLVNMSATQLPLASLGIAAGNTLEALVGAYCLRRLNFQNSMERTKDVVMFIGVAAFGSTLISATTGIATSWMVGALPSSALASGWGAWWVGDMTGDLMITPFILVLSQRLPRPIQLSRVLEMTALLILLVGGSLLIFTGWGSPRLNYYLRIHHLFPFLIWAALRFDQRGVVVTTLIVSAIATWGTIMGYGPFATQGLTENLMSLQLFVAVLAITFLVFGSQVAENKKAMQDRQDLIAIVSHDLKNPLGSILLASKLVNRELVENDHNKVGVQQTEIILRAGHRMQHLLDDLSEISKIESGTLVITPKPDQPQPLLNEATEFLKPLADKKSIQLISELESTCGEIFCDRDRVIQVLSNLIGNAIKFTPSRGLVKVSVSERDSEAHFMVEDSGPGIPSDQLPHIFERYWQARRTGRGEGAGLGLFIAKGIVEAHRGRIWVESQMSGGSKFHFTIPLSRGPRAV